MTLPDSPFCELPALLLVAAGIGFLGSLAAMRVVGP